MPTSQEFLIVSPQMNAHSLESIICNLDYKMVKMLDQQLEELRELALKIKRKFGIDLPQSLQIQDSGNGETEVDSIELIKQLLEKFFTLDNYIDKLR